MIEFNIYEVIGFVTGLLGVWLATRQNVWTWPVGLIGVLAYTVYNFQLKLYADVGLQLFYTVSGLYGWYEWLYGGRNHKELPVSKMTGNQVLLALFSGSFFTVLLAYIFGTYTDASFPFFDSALVAFSLVGQVLLTRKKIENWILWLVVDTGYVGMYILKGSYLTATLYFIFLGLAVKGFLDWRRELKTPTE
jgi:nicotinamide mononucleotide transporter